MGPHVFGDGRLGLIIVDPRYLLDRVPKIRAWGGGAITDLFLPRSATPYDMDVVREGGLSAHLIVADDGLGADALAQRTIEDIGRLGPGALELNVEGPSDAALEPYLRRVLAGLRHRYPYRRIRLNVRWRKAGFLPVDLLEQDRNLYVDEQNYVDPPGSSMVPTSAGDAVLELLEAGVPLAKAAVCYGAAGPVGGRTGAERVCTLPVGWAPRRGVIFQDDLMAEVGLL